MKHDKLTGAELNVFGSDAWRHPITGGIIETGRGAADPVDQALAHAAALERTDEKAGKAMREAVIADHNQPKLKPVAKLQAEQKVELEVVTARQKSELDTLKENHRVALEAAQAAEKKAVEAGKPAEVKPAVPAQQSGNLTPLDSLVASTG
jgi:hypothetical protein